MKTLYIDCSSLIEHVELNTGIQRVVRQVVHHLNTVGPDHGLAVQPVVISHGRFLAIQENQLYPKPRKADEAEDSTTRDEQEQSPLPQYKPVSLSKGEAVVGYLRGVYYGVLTLLMALAGNHERARRFLFAPRQYFGMNWLVFTILVQPFRSLWLLGNRLAGKRGETPSEHAQDEQATDDSQPRDLSPFQFIQKDDILLLLDSSWHNNIWPSVDCIRERGAWVVAVIYDLIPITHPQYCDNALAKVFSKWFTDSVGRVDGFVAISETVQKDLQGFLEYQAPGQFSSAQFDHFWLGADFSHSQPAPDQVRDGIRQKLLERPTYLVVSTIEPRKNHEYVLDAFDELWAEDADVNLLLVGRSGWKVEQLLARIRRHRLAGKKLFHWQDLSDAELTYCYENARMLIFPSRTEGFGLPIVESLSHGLPVLASNIPVLREVGGNQVGYFNLEDPQELVRLVQDVELNGVPEALQVPEDFRWLNWAESTEQLMGKVTQLTQRLRQ